MNSQIVLIACLLFGGLSAMLTTVLPSLAYLHVLTFLTGCTAGLREIGECERRMCGWIRSLGVNDFHRELSSRRHTCLAATSVEGTQWTSNPSHEFHVWFRRHRGTIHLRTVPARNKGPLEVNGLAR